MTSSNSVRLGMFYQFLSQRFNTSQEMVDEIDGCWTGDADGVIVKGEFRQFMRDNWDCFDGQDLTDKDINLFWRNMDTQQSAKKLNGTKMKDLNGLNENELEKVNQQLAVYQVLNTFMQTVNLPSEVSMLGLDNREFKNSINTSLMETCQQVIRRNQNLSVSELEALLQQELTDAYPNALKKTIANMVAQKAVTDLSNLPELGNLENHAFEDLQGLIDNYVRNRATSDDFDINAGGLTNLINEIRYIVKKYFEDAQVNSSNILATQIYTGYSEPSDLSQLSAYTLDPANGMSDLQTLRIKEKLTSDLSSITSQWGYDSISEYLDYYKDLYINHLMTGGSDFNTLFNMTNIADDFKNYSPAGITIEQALKLHVNAEMMKDDWVFHEWMRGEFSDDIIQRIETPVSDEIADAIFQNIPYSDWNKAAHEKIKSGEITSKQELYEFYYTQISQNLSEYVGSEELSIEALNNAYDAEVAGIEGDNTLSGAERLQKLKEAAIKYCDAVVQKGSAAQDAVHDAFGENYQNTINGYTSGYDLKTKMNRLKETLLQLENNNELNGPNTDNIAELNGFTGTKRLGGNGNGENDYYLSLKNAIDDAKTSLRTLLDEMKYKLSLSYPNNSSALNAALETTIAYYDTLFADINSMNSAICNDSWDVAAHASNFIESSSNGSFGIIRGDDADYCDELLNRTDLISGNSGLIITCANGNVFGANHIWRIDIDQSVLFQKLLENANIQNSNEDNTDSTTHIDNCNFESCFFSEFKNEQGWATDSQAAIASFRNKIGQALYDAAIADGIDTAKARNAMNTLNSYYENAIRALNAKFDLSGNGLTNINQGRITEEGSSFTYTDYSTNPARQVTVNDKSLIKLSRSENSVNSLGDFVGYTSATGLYVGCDITAKDAFAFIVDPATVIAKFKSFLG